jgi:hypothetical protein
MSLLSTWLCRPYLRNLRPLRLTTTPQPESWGLEKLIAMCVQEEERIKESCGDSVNHVKHHKKKNFSNSS